MTLVKMEDFKKHALTSWDWVHEYRRAFGEKKYNETFNRMYTFIRDIPEGKFFDIRKVQEENRDLFIKICCMFVLEQRHYIGDFWTLSDDYTKFIHKKHV